MHEPIRAIWEEFSAGLDIPRYELRIAKRGFLAGVMALFNGILDGSITSGMAPTIMSEVRAFLEDLEVKA